MKITLTAVMVNDQAKALNIQAEHERLTKLDVVFTLPPTSIPPTSMPPTSLGPAALAVLDGTCGNLIGLAREV